MVYILQQIHNECGLLQRISNPSTPAPNSSLTVVNSGQRAMCEKKIVTVAVPAKFLHGNVNCLHWVGTSWFISTQCSWKRVSETSKTSDWQYQVSKGFVWELKRACSNVVKYFVSIAFMAVVESDLESLIYYFPPRANSCTSSRGNSTLKVLAALFCGGDQTVWVEMSSTFIQLPASWNYDNQSNKELS